MASVDGRPTLTEFLLARIAEDEEKANQSLQIGDKGVAPLRIGAPDAPPTMIVHPWRMLAECEAKRRIVDLHRINVDKDVKRGRFNEATREFETCDYGYCYECDHDRDYGYIGSPNGLNGCPTLRLLALPYADHPDYDQEWRP